MWHKYLCQRVCKLVVLGKLNVVSKVSRCTMGSEQNFLPRSTRIGVVQMTSNADKQHNMHQAKELILKAKGMDARMVFLPECFDYVSENRENAIKDSEALTGKIVQFYCNVAKEESVWLSLGGLHENGPPGDQRVYNTHLIIDNKGIIKGKYSKTHLFDVDIQGKVTLKETDFAIPGKHIGPPIDSPCGKIGMAICYDLRFPEISTALIQQGAEILTYPSAFTVPTGKAHWEVLLRSRAIENQCYVIAAAQVGKHNTKRSSYGHALIVDPWGQVLGDCGGEDIGVVVAEINLDELWKKRNEMPVQNHRRHDLYGHIITRQLLDIDNVEDYTFGQHTVKSSSIFYRTALSYAVVNRKPVLPGHVLVCPIRKVEKFAELTPSEVADLWNVVQKVSSVLQTHHKCTSATLCIQDGAQAGQTVKHVHVHILPRKEGDFNKNDDIYDKLESHDKEVKQSEWRTHEDMAAEAVLMRPYFL